jgi:hypothetical protein
MKLSRIDFGRAAFGGISLLTQRDTLWYNFEMSMLTMEGLHERYAV